MLSWGKWWVIRELHSVFLTCIYFANFCIISYLAPSPEPCITKVMSCCYKPFSQWQGSFQATIGTTMIQVKLLHYCFVTLLYVVGESVQQKIVTISHCCNPSSYNIFLSLLNIEISQVIKSSSLRKARIPLFYKVKSQDISNHVISVVIPEYSRFHIRKVNIIIVRQSSWAVIIAQVYRLSAVHCQMTRYSQRVPGYLTRYSVSANEISFDQKISQSDCVFQIRLGLEDNDSPLHLLTSTGFLKA